MYQDREITPMLLFAIFSAVLGMFQFGFNTGVMNAPQKVLEEYIANVYKTRTGQWITEELRDVLWSIVVSVFAIGGMIGGLLAPMAANWCGRKTGLVLNNTIAVLGVTLMSSSQLSQSIECLVAGRFFIGLNCGLNTVLVPMYLSEIATVHSRGALGTVSQLGVTAGLLLSQILGLKECLGTKEHWPFLFGFAFVPAILQLIMLPFCPESPRYLLLNCNRLSEARWALRRLRGGQDIEHDIEEIRAEESHEQEQAAIASLHSCSSSLNTNNTNTNNNLLDNPHQTSSSSIFCKLSSIRELFQQPALRTPMIIGIMMQLSQQLSGINAIFYYSTDIFLSAEVPENYAVYATMAVGAIMVLMTLISIPLMDRIGRRTLHLYGLAGMFLASIFLTISLLVKFLYEWMRYISVVSILFYTLFFGIGPGSIPFLITAELFTQSNRPAAMSVSVLVNWFSNFVVGLTFPLMKRLLQSYLFLPYTVFLAIFWIFTYKKLPETKNRTFEEIASIFRPIQLDSPSFHNNFVALGGAISEDQLVQPNSASLTTPNGPGGPLSGANQQAVNLANHFRFDEAIQAVEDAACKQQLPTTHEQKTSTDSILGKGFTHPGPIVCYNHNNNNNNQLQQRTTSYREVHKNQDEFEGTNKHNHPHQKEINKSIMGNSISNDPQALLSVANDINHHQRNCYQHHHHQQPSGTTHPGPGGGSILCTSADGGDINRGSSLKTTSFMAKVEPSPQSIARGTTASCTCSSGGLAGGPNQLYNNSLVGANDGRSGSLLYSSDRSGTSGNWVLSRSSGHRPFDPSSQQDCSTTETIDYDTDYYRDQNSFLRPRSKTLTRPTGSGSTIRQQLPPEQHNSHRHLPTDHQHQRNQTQSHQTATLHHPIALSSSFRTVQHNHHQAGNELLHSTPIAYGTTAREPIYHRYSGHCASIGDLHHYNNNQRTKGYDIDHPVKLTNELRGSRSDDGSNDGDAI